MYDEYVVCDFLLKEIRYVFASKVNSSSDTVLVLYIYIYIYIYTAQGEDGVNLFRASFLSQMVSDREDFVSHSSYDLY